MINSWLIHGVWGDPRTPDASEVFVPLVGSWTSELIDVSEGVEFFEGEVTHGYLFWNERLPKGASVLFDVLVNDTGEWQRGLTRGTPIERAREWNDVPYPSVRLHARVFGLVGDVTSLPNIHLSEIALILSRIGSWEKRMAIPLSWSRQA